MTTRHAITISWCGFLLAAAGLGWPVHAASAPIPPPQSTTLETREPDGAWWAFKPIRRPRLPIAHFKADMANPIDALIAAELATKGLTPNPLATKRELIRRAYFDLIGLPPSPEQAAAFEQDRSPDAYERLLDQLLARPQYGERWGRHWLDLVRFAQSNGYERDGEKPLAWRYRDYIIKAFNEDKPYDRFVQDQIAGDELPLRTPDSLIATGFQRLGVWDDEPDDKRMAVFDELDDILATTGAAFLGLTLGCARCHDHKFDPIPQTDYYQLLAFFRNVRPHENTKLTLDSASYTPLAEPETVRLWQAEQQATVKKLEVELARASNDNEKKQLQERLKQVKDIAPPFDWALSVREKSAPPEPTHVLIRGHAAMPGPEVTPAFLSVFGAAKPELNPVGTNALSCGRRLVLAQWMTRPENPLLARVLVNRLWQHHFGQGIVKTTADFGRAGVPPTHPQLLDWLAAEFIDSGWSIKRMHQLIMRSRTYRQSSNTQNPPAQQADPGNDWLWRQNLRRLEAEAIRDSLLAISGQLNLKMGGRGFFPPLSGEVLAGQSRPGLDWQIDNEAEQCRRSVYTFIRRTMLVPILDNFDYSNTATVLGERPVTTVAPQALLLLNDDELQRQAAAFARRLVQEAGPKPEQQIRRAYQVALNREPTPKERQIGLAYLQRQAQALEALPSQLRFNPQTPSSLSVEYLRQMTPAHFLSGPRDHWSYHQGRWSTPYEGIRTVDRLRGPFALWEPQAFADGVIEAKLILQKTAEFGGLLFRAKLDGEEHRGYDVLFDPRQQRVSLRRHATNVTTLAVVDSRVPTGTPFPVKIEAVGSRIRVWTHDRRQPLIEVVDPQSINEPGQIGVRTWGGSLCVEDLMIQPVLKDQGERPQNVIRVQSVPTNARQQALQSFCLLMLNLNEVVYVD